MEFRPTTETTEISFQHHHAQTSYNPYSYKNLWNYLMDLCESEESDEMDEEQRYYEDLLQDEIRRQEEDSDYYDSDLEYFSESEMDDEDEDYWLYY